MNGSNNKNDVLEKATPVDKFEWSVLDNGTVRIDSYKGDDKNVVIPAEIDGKRVTMIGDDAFFGCKSLELINIPVGVTSIGACTFADCVSLKSINIPDSVTEIGTRAFYGCKSFTSITVPDSVKVIKPFAFRECTSLTSIKLPDGAYKGVGVLMGTPLADKYK